MPGQGAVEDERAGAGTNHRRAHRLQQLAHALTDQGIGILDCPGPFHPGGIDQQGHLVWDEPDRSSNLDEPVKRIAFFAIGRQPGPKHTQAGRMKPGIVQGKM